MPICVTPKSQRIYSRDEHTMVPDVLIISTDVLNKLGDKERTALLKAADESDDADEGRHLACG
ncbi:hypothetical protein DMI65_08130 [Escherichia coli]|nr:hypothetical protein [Escherichia coli]